jgi:glycerol uptake facilitator-like aquaporin
MKASFSFPQRLTAECVGTALLVAIVVGSGIMAERLAGGNVAVALIGNCLATGAGLAVLILIFGPVSGCHINPAVTLSFCVRGEIGVPLAAGYVLVQITGGIAGVMLAHVMFDLPLIVQGTQARTDAGQWIGEIVATFGLLMVILGCLRFRAEAVPFAVGLYIMGGYWFTSSTSFANPAVTIARALTDTFTGIRPRDVAPFIGAEIIGALVACALAAWLFKSNTDT